MPITCHFHPDAELVVLTHTGAVTDEEFLATYRGFIADPRLDKSFDLLVDLRNSDSSGRTPATLREFAGIVQRHYAGQTERPKAAVIAPRDLSYGLARVYEAYSDISTMELVVFRALDAALEWLGVPDTLSRQIRIDQSPQGPGSA